MLRCCNSRYRTRAHRDSNTVRWTLIIKPYAYYTFFTINPVDDRRTKNLRVSLIHCHRSYFRLAKTTFDRLIYCFVGLGRYEYTNFLIATQNSDILKRANSATHQKVSIGTVPAPRSGSLLVSETRGLPRNLLEKQIHIVRGAVETTASTAAAVACR